MANTKISALTSATTPLAGTETLPIVQSSATVKVAVSNLTAGRAVSAASLTLTTTPLPVTSGGTGVTTSTGTGNTVLSAAPTLSGDVTLSTGNLVIGTAGKGIDFSATPGTGTSELLSDYEEGTWTPNQGAAVTVVGAFSSSGTYTKVGRLVTIVGTMSGATSIAVGAPNIITSNLPFTAADNTPAGITAGVSSGGSAIVIGTSTQLYSVTTFGASGSAIIFSATYFV